MKIKIEVEVEVDEQYLDIPKDERGEEIPDDMVNVSRVTVELPDRLRSGKVEDVKATKLTVGEPPVARLNDGVLHQVTWTDYHGHSSVFGPELSPIRQQQANALSMICMATMNAVVELFQDWDEDSLNEIR